MLNQVSKEENDVSKHEIKIQDFTKILQSLEKICETGSNGNSRTVSFIKKLRHALRPYRHMSGSEFLDLIKNPDSRRLSPSPMRKQRYRIETLSPDGIIPFSKLRMYLSEGNLTKDQMISIAKRQFGLTKGTLLKLRKEEIKKRIESAMQNIETLRTIQKKAVE